jgi:uncharacterized protein YjiS (DUF1127 family)
MTWTSRIEIILPVRGLSLRDLAARIRQWRQRSRSRRHLRRLDERLLRDIGVDRLEAQDEARKPFWRG